MTRDPLIGAVEELITSSTGRIARITHRSQVGGGCIHESGMVSLDDGRRFFVKSNADSPPDIFEREREGLEALRATGTIRVARALGAGGGTKSIPPFLVLEAIDPGVPRNDFMETFGHELASLHRAPCLTTGPDGRAFGFGNDNYLGATRQPNAWARDWVDFWRRRRLGHQLELARRRALSDPELDRLGDRLLDRLDTFLADPAEPPSLLHGDLWGGNYLVDPVGLPVLVDPATYYGRREAELAMTRLFGGFEPRFYDAYHEAWPLAPGSEERLVIYELYHLLNHLNLFGRGYRPGCISRLRRLVG